MSERSEKAVALHKAGFNCAQAVFVAYADQYGIDKELACRLSASFGGGIGMTRETCGCFSGVCMLAGLEKSAITAEDKETKMANYHLVQELSNKFANENGSTICGELKGLRPVRQTGENLEPRQCDKLIESACKIWEDYRASVGK